MRINIVLDEELVHEAQRDPLAAHVEAARIFFECRRRGVTIPSSTDCLIACLVLERDGVLQHEDEDFERIRTDRPLRTMQ